MENIRISVTVSVRIIPFEQCVILTFKSKVLFLQIYRAFLASASACFATTTFCKRISSYIGLQACVLHYYIDYYLLLLLVCLVLFWYCCFGVLLLNSKSS
jgi:hypothetical protein